MNKKIIAPILSIAALGAISIGTTYALFTSKANSQVNINAGIVKVNYSSTLDAAYSRYLDFPPFDAIAAASGTNFDAVFENGGTAKINEDNSTILSIERMAPMDSLYLTTKAFNASNINIKYRYVVELDGELIPALSIFIDGTDYSTDLEHKVIYSVWSDVVSPDVEGLFQKDVRVYFPYGGEEQNAYQNKNCTIKIGIEAVQGNATVVNEQTNPEIPSFEIIYSAKPSADDKFTDMQNSNGTVRAEVKGSSVDSTADKLTFTIEKMDECHEDTPITEVNNFLPLDLQIEEIKEGNTDPIKMSADIGPGKKGVSVYHEGEQVEDATYDNVTGIVSWTTLSCSQFDILWEIDLVTNYTELAAAIAADSPFIRLANDITDVPNTGSVVIDCSTTLDGYGHTLSHTDGQSSGNHPVIGIGSDDLDIRIENLKIVNHKYSGITNNYSNVNLTVDNCEIESWFNIMFINQNVGDYHSENCNLLIEDSTFTLNQTYSGTTNGALSLQINGYNQNVVVNNSKFFVTSTTDSAECAVIGGSNYKWSTGGSNMGDCSFELNNCDITINGESAWFYYFDCDEEYDTNAVLVNECKFVKEDVGESLFTNPYAFNYPVVFDHCDFNIDVSEVTEAPGTHPTPLHFVQNADGTWSSVNA